MKKWVVTLALLASVVAFGTVGALGLTVVNQSRENAALQKQLNVARQETRVARRLARETQNDIAKLLKRQRQLTNFIRRHGFDPPSPSNPSGNQNNGTGSEEPDNPPPNKPKPPKKPPEPGPSPNPSPEECFAELLGVCV